LKEFLKKLAHGKSCRAIATDLNLDKISTPSQYAIAHGAKVAKVSQNWSDSRIREILLNEVYIGNMVQGRMKKMNYKSKKNIRLPKEQWKIVNNTHKPIIDKETFYKAHQMLQTRKQTRIKTHDYLLKGLVYCHECGKKVSCSPRELSNGKVYYFRCNTYISNSKLGLCTPHNIRMDIVEKAVTNTILDILNDFSNKNDLVQITKSKIAENKKNISFQKEIQEYEIKLNKISLDIDNIYNDKLSSIIAEDDFIRIYQKKQQEKENLQSKIKKLKLHIEHTFVNEDELVKKIVTKFQNLQQINREILCNLVDKIEIDKNKKIYIYFK